MGNSSTLIAALSLCVASAALLISAINFWLTLVRRGRILMTRPTVIYFGPDGSRFEGSNKRPKIFLRGLLISSSKRGRIVENLYASLHREETKQNFSVWVYGDDNLKRGSGLYVNENGLVTNHHFLMSDHDSDFRFRAGEYELDIFANVLGDNQPTKLFQQTLPISQADSESLSSGLCGIYFDWIPQSRTYIGRVDKKLDIPTAKLQSGLARPESIRHENGISPER